MFNSVSNINFNLPTLYTFTISYTVFFENLISLPTNWQNLEFETNSILYKLLLLFSILQGKLL